jgi:hypothetical protein
VQHDLLGQLRAKLSEKGLTWSPARDGNKGTA